MHSPKLIVRILHDAKLSGHIDLGQAKRFALERRYIPVHLELTADHTSITLELNGSVSYHHSTHSTPSGQQMPAIATAAQIPNHMLGRFARERIASRRRTWAFVGLHMCNRTPLVIVSVSVPSPSPSQCRRQRRHQSLLFC